jgi:glycosyltransferase involved in cell wall biosynthesis
MISIIIPTFKDPFLQKTIDSLFENSQGEIEIIPVLDGYVPEVPIKKDPRVKVVILSKNQGMRAAINAGIVKAKGEFIMKCDSHCVFGPGYDKIMAENCAENWLMIPRRYSLNDTSWQRYEDKEIRDYHYLAFPVKSKEYGLCLNNVGYWPERARLRKDPQYDIDDTMTFQGSCWLANKKYFMKHVGFLDDREKTYGTFVDEPQEIGLKYWLSGGENKVIKKTWYAHLSKRPHHYQAGLFARDYKINNNAVRSRSWSAEHWFNNKEPGMIHPFFWLVEKFWPVRTWPEDRNLWIFPK